MMRLGRKPQETMLRTVYLHRGDDPDAPEDRGMLVGQIAPPWLAAEVCRRWNVVDAPTPPVGERPWPVATDDRGQLTTDARRTESVGQFLGLALANEVCRRWALAEPAYDDDPDDGITTADLASLRAILRSNMLDGDEGGQVTMTAADLLDEVCDLVGEWAPARRARWVAAELRTCAGSIQQGDLYDERQPVADFLNARAAALARGTDE
jgi:hypothetical protein